MTYVPGVKPGDWWQYGDVTGNCPNPCQILGFSESLKVASAITRVTGVTGTNVSVTSTISYANGTVTSASYSGDLATGIGNLPDGLALIAANLNHGDPIFNSPYAPILNSTIRATYAGASRQVNIWNFTSTAPKGIATVYFDKLTGIVLGNKIVSGSSFLSDRVTGTSLWPYNVTIWDNGACTPTGQDCKFDPANITIDQGTAVEWNNTGQLHTATSCSGINFQPFGCPRGANLSSLPSFDSGILSRGQTYWFSFNVAGNYSYYCVIHPWLQGFIRVQTNTTTPPTIHPPVVTITGINPNPAFTGQLITISFNVNSMTTMFGVDVGWGDGTTTHPGATATSDTHTYTDAGAGTSEAFKINVTARNSAGQGSAVTEEKVSDRSPTLTMTGISPSPTSPGQIVRMNFTASDPDGTISLININWGDGSIPDLVLPMNSGSMCQRLNPNLHTNACTLTVGDLILARSQDPNTITNNTIIVFRVFPAYPNYVIVHRVIKIIPATQSITHQVAFWTMGDANPVPDSWDQPNTGIQASQIIGVYQYTLAPSNGILTTIYGYDTHTYASTGSSKSESFTINATAIDNSGSTNTVLKTETVNDQPPNVSPASLSANHVETSQTVIVNFSAVDSDGTISSISVNWGDGSAPDIFAGSATSDTHSYTRAGSFTIIITGTDNSGSTTHVPSSPITVTAPPAPSAPAPNILGLAPTEFYAIIGTILIITIITTAFLASRTRKVPDRTNVHPD
jgi:plastocyanin